MAKINEVGKVYSTLEYGLFRQLEGNRGVLNSRKKKVCRSVDEVGYIPIPIIVNESYEIIDGAARYEVCVQKGLPIVYTVVPNVGLKECVAINTASTNWCITDYIKSYAETGNDNYIRFHKLIERYGQSIPMLSIWNAITEQLSVDNHLIRSGKLFVPNEVYLQAIDTLNYSSKFKSVFGRIGGRKEYYFDSINYIYMHNVVDTDRLEKKIYERQANFFPIITMEQALSSIEDAYNHCARTKEYILTEYKKYMDKKYSWYRTRYMKKGG